MTPGPHWTCVHFGSLTPTALYRILQARQAVFVVEQRCVFQDLDGLDAQAWHLAAWAAASTDGESPAASNGAGALLAYARLLQPGLRFEQAAIGRVLTLGEGRGVGLGQALMRRALVLCEQHWPGQGVQLAAQAHLAPWYRRLGFAVVGEPFDEDGIEHVLMRQAGPP